MTSVTHTPSFERRARTTAHTEAVQLGIHTISDDLVRVLGRQLVSIIVGKNPRTVERWSNGQNAPATADEQTLRNTYQVYSLLREVEGDHTIRAWFMGMNPQLDDASPAEALAAGHAREVMAAARAFVTGG